MTTPENIPQIDFNDDYYIQVDRAISELRKGRAVSILIENESFLAYAAETSLSAEFPIHLVISGARLKKLFACNDMFESSAYSIYIDSADEMRSIEPIYNSEMPFDEEEFVGTFESAEEFSFLLKLAGDAELLPAVYVMPVESAPSNVLPITEAAVRAFSRIRADSLQKVVEATLPTPDANVKVVLFRPESGGMEHMAICFGDITSSSPPLVRVHSSCLTGDVLSSLRCDCGDQLRSAFKQISSDDGGVIVYINQEGRGIGLANKLRAYNLQDSGMDTYDANLALGFAEDERDFPIAAQILKLLNIQKIKLLTNNPKKVQGMKEFGIDVVQQVNAQTIPHNHNLHYLETKATKGNHRMSGLKTEK